MVGMYAQALCMDRIRPEFVEPINQQLATLAGYVDIPFADLLAREKAKCAATPQDSGTAKGGAPAGGTLPRLGRNVSLRGLAPLKLNKTARLDANRRAMEVLAGKPGRSGYPDADLDALRLYTGNGGLQVDSAGVLNQHYTSYSVARFAWDKLVAMGAPEGWYLEPGCGAGNFIGLKPSTDYGVVGFDYDPVAVSVARALYPDDEILAADARDFPWDRYRSFCVGAVGNVPFGNYSRYRRGDRFEKLKPLIHDGLILHSLDTVRPGGVAALISSAGTMDKRNDRIRRAMVEMAHFVGAYRLPNTAFKDNASTEVTTDLLFFQKRTAPATDADLSDLDRAFIETVDDVGGVEGSHVSRYYIDRPDRMLGRLEIGVGQFKTQTGVVGKLTDEMLAGLVAAGDMAFPDPVAERVEMPAGAAQSYTPLLTPEIASCEALLASLKGVLARQQDGAPQAERDAARTALRTAATAHVTRFGLPSASKAVKSAYEGTSDLYSLAALVSGKPGALVFSDVASRDTLFSASFEPKPASSRLADVALFLRQTGAEATVADLARASGRAEADVDRAVRLGTESVYLNPASDRVEVAFEYLAGHLPPKIEAAETAGLTANASALRAVLPAPLTAAEITFDLLDANTYLPADVAAAYVSYAVGGRLVGVKRNWIIDPYDAGQAHGAGWGWKSDYAQILTWYLNGEGYRKEATPKDAEPEERARAQEDKAANENKMRRVIPKRFTEWLRLVADDAMRERAALAWNTAFNSTIEPAWTGDTFTLAGLGATWTNGLSFEPRLHQKRFVERALYTGGFLNAHGVGAGKTLPAIMLAGALRQRGMARKPLFVVPGKVLEKWIAEFLAAFPAARILNLRTDKARRELGLSMLQQNEYDAVFVTHEGFRGIPASPALTKDYFDVRLAYIRDEIAKLSEQLDAKEVAAAMDAAANPDAKVKLTIPAKRLKQLYLNLFRAEQKVTKAAESEKDTAVYWDDLGVDAVFIDEAHNFKNYFLSDLAVELGIGVPESSDRAEEAMMKLFDVNRKSAARGEGERGVYLLTATPTNNSPLEALTFLQMVAPSYLRSIGIEHPDDFIRQFARIENILTLDLVGNAREKNVVVGYKSLGVLRRIFNRYVEFLDVDALNAIRREEARRRGEDPATVTGLVVRPKLTGEPVYLVPGARDSIVRIDLEQRVKSIKEKKPSAKRMPGGKESVDNYLSVSMTGSRGAVDVNFYEPRLMRSEGLHTRGIAPGSKAATMCDAVRAAYWTVPRTVKSISGEETANVLNGQLIFCDPITTAEDAGAWNFHRAIKARLVASGIPAAEIAIVNGQENAATDKKKAVQDAFNGGSVRVIIGNTASMGEGMDLNRYCTDIHHLDVPWKPSELTQRNGRGHRQGNVNATVTAHYYLMKRSMDVYRFQLLVKKQRWIDELWNGADEEADGESDTGLDYETVMMSLQDNPVRIKALDLSRQAKRARGLLENATDDFRSAEIAVQNARRAMVSAERLVPTAARAMFEAVTSLTPLDGPLSAALGTTYPRSTYGNTTGGGARVGSVGVADEGRTVYNLPAYTWFESGADGRRHVVAEIVLSRERDFSGFYYAAFTGVGTANGLKPYRGKDRDLAALVAKVQGAMKRYVVSFPGYRADAMGLADRFAASVVQFGARLVDAQTDVTEAKAVADGWTAQILAFAAEAPGAAALIDWKAAGVARPETVSAAVAAETNDPADEEAEALEAVAALRDEAVAGDDAPRTNPRRAAPRANPSSGVAVAVLGLCDRLDVEGGADGRSASSYTDGRGDTLLVWVPELGRLLAVPRERARTATAAARHDDTRGDALDVYEEWLHDAADGVALALDLPDAALWPRLPAADRVGTGDAIWYRSDKRMEPGDGPGQLNGYHHRFHRGRRAVHEIHYPTGGSPVLVVSGISVNGRGILN